MTRQDFWQLIIRLLGEGVAVVVSTPYMDEAERCSRLGFMYSGRILREGAPSELAASLAGRVMEVVAQPMAEAEAVCLADADVEDVLAFGDRLHLRLHAGVAASGEDGPAARLTQALSSAGVHVGEVRAIPPSLEDAFVALLEDVKGGRVAFEGSLQPRSVG